MKKITLLSFVFAFFTTLAQTTTTGEIQLQPILQYNLMSMDQITQSP